MEFCCHDVPFMYNNKWYKQTDGVSMGSPLAPTLASFFMTHLEKKMLHHANRPLLYGRYVDDMFAIFQDDSQVELFHEYINNIHDNIKFTVERSKCHKLGFLDVHVHHSDNGIITSHFRKASATELFTSAYSFCESNYKHSMIKGLIHRIWCLNSTYEKACTDIDNICNILTKNGYRKEKIDRIAAHTIHRLHTHDNKDQNTDKQKEENRRTICVTVPYSTGFQNFKHSINKLNLPLRFISQTHKIASFFTNKCKTPIGLQANLVYNFKCHGCDTQYIGETSRHLKTRLAEHSQLSRKSHILDHNLNCKLRTHKLNESEFKILKSGLYYYRERLSYEALCILKSKPPLNVQDEFSKYIKIFK